MSKIWVIFSKNGMPLAIEKCEFRPTICPYGASHDGWIRAYLENELTEKEVLENRILAHQEAMRPLLEKWSKLK